MLPSNLLRKGFAIEKQGLHEKGAHLKCPQWTEAA